MRLTLRVSAVGGAGCNPLSGAIVDVWQCDAVGVYSGVNEPGSQSTAAKNFLRGYQITETDGSTQFTTIYPGWYPGRTVHIHFKVRASAKSGRGQELTSQLYFDDALTDRIHAQSPYAGKGPRTVKNQRDGLFRNGGRPTNALTGSKRSRLRSHFRHRPSDGVRRVWSLSNSSSAIRFTESCDITIANKLLQNWLLTPLVSADTSFYVIGVPSNNSLRHRRPSSSKPVELRSVVLTA